MGTQVVELSGSDMDTLREAFDLYYEQQMKTMIPETIKKWENAERSILIDKVENGVVKEKEGSRVDGLADDLDIDLEVLCDLQRLRKELNRDYTPEESDLGVIVYREDAERKIRENADLLNGTPLTPEYAVELICNLLGLQSKPERMIISEDE